MSYKKVSDILPAELINIIQEYVEGEYIYIPKKDCNKKAWGYETKSKEKVYQRNLKIYQKYNSGMSIKEISKEYYLSPKWVYKIIAKLAE